MTTEATTLAEAFRETVRRRPDAPAVRVGTRTVAYAEQMDLAARFGTGLLALGHEPGAPVALWLPNRPEWVTAFLGCAMVGCPPVAVNSRYRSDELEHVLTDSGATTLIVQPSLGSRDYLSMTASVCPALERADPDGLPGSPSLSVERVFVVTDAGGEELPSGARQFATVLDAGDPAAANYDTVVPADPCGVFYTSGTTSAPKGVVHDQRSVVTHARVVADWFGVSGDDVGLLVMPAYGLIGFDFLWSVLLSGATLIPHQRFDAETAAATIERRGVTYLFGVGDIFDGLMETDADLTSLERGSAILASPGQLRAVEERCGFPIVQPYGSTELHSHVLVSHPDEPFDQRADPGGPVISPEIEAAVRDPETDTRNELNATGELLVRGYVVMDEYLGRAAATTEVVDDEGWFVTGDLCRIDDRGHLRYYSRIDDALRVRGHLISPHEIERALLDHERVEEAVVVGVEAGSHQHRLVAFVRRAPDTGGRRVEELRSRLDARVADYKVPEVIVAVDEYPTVVGPNGEKVQRSVLQERAADLLAERSQG